MKPTIICLIGESGSGKTTIAMEMENRNVEIIHSYTTRAPRSENEWGHLFKTKEEILEENNKLCIKDPSKINQEISAILRRDENITAYTLYKNNFYWITKSQYMNEPVVLYVVDQQGYKTLLESAGDVNVISVYLSTTEETRLSRVASRSIDSAISKALGGGSIDVIKPEYIQTAIEESIDRVKYDRDHFYEMDYDYVIDTNGDINESLACIDSILNGLFERYA